MQDTRAEVKGKVWDNYFYSLGSQSIESLTRQVELVKPRRDGNPLDSCSKWSRGGNWLAGHCSQLDVQPKHVHQQRADQQQESSGDN